MNITVVTMAIMFHMRFNFHNKPSLSCVTSCFTSSYKKQWCVNCLPDLRENLSLEELTIMSVVSLVMSPVTACITTLPSLVSHCPELETTLESGPWAAETSRGKHKTIFFG